MSICRYFLTRAPTGAPGIGRIGIRRSRGIELTESERRIAELAATGMTNRQIAATVLASPKTVEANLARVYRELGITSRAELGARIAEPAAGSRSPRRSGGDAALDDLDVRAVRDRGARAAFDPPAKERRRALPRGTGSDAA